LFFSFVGFSFCFDFDFDFVLFSVFGVFTSLLL